MSVDLAETLDAIAVVERRDAVEVADRWFHDQPASELPDSGADSGRPDTTVDELHHPNSEAAARRVGLSASASSLA